MSCEWFVGEMAVVLVVQPIDRQTMMSMKSESFINCSFFFVRCELFRCYELQYPSSFDMEPIDRQTLTDDDGHDSESFIYCSFFFCAV